MSSMYHRTEFGPMPKLNISQEQLKITVRQILKGKTGGISFTFVTERFKQFVHAKPEQYGYQANPNVSYTGGLDRNNISQIREIIWDLIVLRNLTVGNFDSDEWPALSVTAQGETYFSSIP